MSASSVRGVLCAVAGASLSVVLLVLAPCSSAATESVYCGPGTVVSGEMGGGPGTIAEIGTEPPHVGWYRIVSSWNTPKGDWYDPSTWKLYREGTVQRCSSRAAEKTPVPPAVPRPSRRPRTDDDDPPPPASTRPPRETEAKPTTGSSAGGSLPTGRYTCSMPGAGQFPIAILDGSSYSDRAGKAGRYSVEGQRIVFSSGSLEAQFSRILGPGKFGLSSDQDHSFYGVCNLKR